MKSKRSSSIDLPAQNKTVPPGLFNIDFQITRRCNLSCTHCYQGNFDQEDPPRNLLSLYLDQCRAFLDFISEIEEFHQTSPPIRASIALTGGEPLLNRDFYEILKEVCSDPKHFSVRILTNGTIINKEWAHRLSCNAIEVVSVSLDGTPETHDSRRGRGVFQKTVRGIRHLVNSSIPTVISFSADRSNFRELPDVAELAKDLGVQRFWSDRCLPIGREKHEDVLTPAQTKEYIHLLQESADRLNDASGGFKVLTHRALQFINTSETSENSFGSDIYQCWAGLFLLSIQANGDLYPCRRLPIKLGNLSKTHLIDIYMGDPTMRELRDLNVPNGCTSCIHAQTCSGGLLCLSYSKTQTFNHPDPGCWLAKQA